METSKNLQTTFISRLQAFTKGRSARGALGTFALKVGGTALGFVSSILLTNLLGTTSYGAYALAFAWVNLLTIPAVLGLGELLVREVSVYRTQGALGKLNGILRWANLTAFLASLVIALLASFIIWRTQGISPSSLAFIIALSSLPLAALTLVRQAALRGLNHIIAGQIPEMLVRPLLLIGFVVGAYLLLGPDFNAAWAVGVSVVATGLSFLVGAWLLRRALSEEITQAAPEYQTGTWLRSAMPFLLIGGVLIINARTDIIMLGWLGTQADAGIYRVVTLGASLIAFVLAAVNAALSPVIAKLYAQGKRERLEATIRRTTRLIFLCSLPIALALIIFGGPFLRIFGPDFPAGQAALAVLSMGFLVDAAAGSVGQMLNMTGHERDSAKAIGASAVLNVVLNLSLIPRFGMVGAATATATSMALYNVLLAIFVYRRFGFYSILGLIDVRRPHPRENEKTS